MTKIIEFTRAPIVVPALAFPCREIGACVEFQGIVRELEKGEILAGLRYEAYETMASKQLERIFNALSAIYPCESVLFIHRLGLVPVGETSLFMRILASHRGEALSFCAEAINRMKCDVPIWKVSQS